MIIWVVQFKRTRTSLPEARIFRSWGEGIRYINMLREPKYTKPILFRADTWERK